MTDSITNENFEHLLDGRMDQLYSSAVNLTRLLTMGQDVAVRIMEAGFPEGNLTHFFADAMKEAPDKAHTETVRRFLIEAYCMGARDGLEAAQKILNSNSNPTPPQQSSEAP
jgi:hypothetical protein